MTRLSYSIAVIPSDGSRPVSVSRTINYTTLDVGINALTTAMLVPPLSAYIPVEVTEEQARMLADFEAKIEDQ